jgi:Asp-tRNA(Asn)/Glu-tRNA(Gln) amidotransferase A subunit family amidase
MSHTASPVFDSDTPEALLRRVQAREPAVRAWAWMDPAGLRDAWAAAPARGRLRGVPIAIKDVIDVAGMPTGNGVAPVTAGPATADADCVTLLRQAGAIPVGKTVTAEMAYAHPGPTRNPWHPQHTPGGSSSGSAAAVACGMVPAALGTQTGGSVIRPAAYCGVVGFKPTYGSVSLRGVTQVAASLDTLGWFTPDVASARTLADVLMPGLPAACPFDPGALSLARLDAAHARPSPSTLALHDDAQARLTAAGASLAPLDIQAEWKTLTAAHRVVMLYEMARAIEPDPRFSATLRAVMEQGLALPETAWRQALADARDCEARLLHALRDVEAVLTPSAPGPAPQGLDHTGDSTFNRIWTLLGWPAIHLPAAWSPQGLPLGLQLVGKPGSDARLLDISAQVHSLVDRR